MPELRRDPTSREWVIIAAERDLRPHEFARPGTAHHGTAAYMKGCPFCPGNEALTPDAVLELPGQGPGGWQVRGFPNKFPALTPLVSTDPVSEEPLFSALSGQGAHEVLVETPIHNRLPADRDEGEMAVLIQAYQERYRALASLDYVKYVLVFKNQGEEAGTSIEHPHSQIIAAPVVPEKVRRRTEIAREYHGRTGRCLYCGLADGERRLATRLVHQNDEFIVFQPFAAARPAETWIVPMEHEPSFGEVGRKQLEALGSVLLRTLNQLRNAFNDPDFNYAVHSAPPDGQEHPHYHWRVQIVPRMTKAAGLELGSGMYVNTMAPEDAAVAMRRAPA